MKQRFGCKVYKLSLSGGMTCPNRDGTIDSRGCIFCSKSGSGDFAEQGCQSISEQIERAKSRVASKIKDGKYIAYFQDFTNTYASVEYLKEIFTEAINHPDVVILSIATRPDCLPCDILDLLENLNNIKPVWVELGLQTIHKSSADYIRRGYPLSVFNKAVKDLKQRGIEVIAHMIIGLPFETEQMIYETAEYIGKSGVNGVKFHLLHVLKNTDLAKEYENKAFEPLSLEKYTDILIECIKRIPNTMAVHRLTGDGAKKELIAPLWSADKKKVLNYINKKFKESNLQQGQLFGLK
ncbi:MAG: TIGR01212 family radical SAM protein [Clostridia bacterium]|nr:TIGR01212 family radical SAM protein [Clostridia bacterium]